MIVEKYRYPRDREILLPYEYEYWNVAQRWWVLGETERQYCDRNGDAPCRIPIAQPSPPYDLESIPPGEAKLPLYCVDRCGRRCVILADNWVHISGCQWRWIGIDYAGSPEKWRSNGCYSESRFGDGDIIGLWENAQ